MSKGRHCARPVSGQRRTTSGSRKAAPGARKAPPEARKASPTRVGGAKVAGRRVAQGDGRPVVLTALGSGEKLFALVPVAILSAAWVAGLATMGDGDSATSPSPADSDTAAGSPRQKTALREMTPRATPSARAPLSETASPVVVGEGAAPEAVDKEPASMDETAAEPADRPAEEEPTTPVETASPTADPEPTDDSDSLTSAEATAQCLASGISTVDVAVLGACVQELLG